MHVLIIFNGHGDDDYVRQRKKWHYEDNKNDDITRSYVLCVTQNHYVSHKIITQ